MKSSRCIVENEGIEFLNRARSTVPTLQNWAAWYQKQRKNGVLQTKHVLWGIHKVLLDNYKIE